MRPQPSRLLTTTRHLEHNTSGHGHTRPLQATRRLQTGSMLKLRRRRSSLVCRRSSQATRHSQATRLSQATRHNQATRRRMGRHSLRRSRMDHRSSGCRSLRGLQ